jgi:hypothetical protein
MSSCECNIYSSITIEALIWICITYMKIPGNEMRFIPNKCNFNNFMLLRIKYEMLSWHTHIVFWSVLQLYYIMNTTIKVSIYTETYINILDLEVNQYPITQLTIYTIIHITWISPLWLFFSKLTSCHPSLLWKSKKGTNMLLVLEPYPGNIIACNFVKFTLICVIKCSVSPK